jgi:hypothetical protein
VNCFWLLADCPPASVLAQYYFRKVGSAAGPKSADETRIGAIFIELLTELVFFGRYRSVFLGIYHTDTDGKLGRYISVSKRGQLPPFFLKRGVMAPFLTRTAPLSRKKGGNDTKKGGTILTENTDTEPI